LIESKSLKLYLWGFREVGIFAEDLAATLLEDLVGACGPREMTVDLTQQVRGGLKIRIVVRHRGEPAGKST
jgi:7-cyano-7-deazaguanine reductase